MSAFQRKILLPCRKFLTDSVSRPNVVISSLYAFSCFAAVFALLFAIGCCFPQEGIGISDAKRLVFPSFPEWFNLKKIDEIEHFVFNLKTGESMNRVAEAERVARSALPVKCTSADIRALPVQPIEFPPDDKNMLDAVWRALRGARNGKTPVRILHYGDSQLEADRISCFLRQNLQQRFGGSGAGYVALNPVIPINPAIQLTLSPNWRHSVSLVKSERRASSRVGHLLSSTILFSGDGLGWIKINRRALNAYQFPKFSQIKLMLMSTGGAKTIDIATPTRILYKHIVHPQSEVQQIVADIADTHEPITITFKGGGNLALYGLALDSRNGVALDNIPLRSSAGLDFVKADLDILKQCYDFLNVEMIILQFGVNIIPYQNTNYKFYEEQVYRQLKYLQQAAPHTPILVIGVSDIARRSANGTLASYPNIEKVRNAQRSAALRADCAFWDTYRAMGGENSIIAWAYAKPPLATKDFCHFSAQGVQLISELFYRSLMQEYR